MRTLTVSPWEYQRVMAFDAQHVLPFGRGGPRLGLPGSIFVHLILLVLAILVSTHAKKVEQVAAGRALVTNPLLLLMDEPSEGLSGLVIQRVEEVCRQLSSSGMAILLIEQNLEMAQTLAHRAYIFVNGRIARELPAGSLAADQHLLHQLLGVTAGSGELRVEQPVGLETEATPEKSAGEEIPEAVIGAAAPTLWSGARLPEVHAPERISSASPVSKTRSVLLQVAVADTIDRAAYIVGTFDTKSQDLLFIKSCLDRLRVRTITVDLSTSRKPSPAAISPTDVARHHPEGAAAVFTGSRIGTVTNRAS